MSRAEITTPEEFPEDAGDKLSLRPQRLVLGLLHDARDSTVTAVLALSGEGFVDCHQLLSQTYGFSEKAAFTIVARIFRSGGLTKDAIYLRGLQQVFDFVAQGNELAPLWFGKIAEHHVPIVHELQQRGLLQTPLATPEFLSRPVAQRQLARIRDGESFIHLISEPCPC